MRTLLQMAKDIGFDVPLYTATGWGGAVTGGMLPVMGGYCEAPWDPSTKELPPSGNYIFTEERNDHGIGSAHGIGEGLTCDMTKFPYLTAELGGGLQVTAHRRPVASAEDIAAMSMVKLGSGCNLLGYYMYHGGTNPHGKRTTLQESRATGYPNDLPELSYDFNAPVREYGQLTDTYRRIRMLSMFVHDYEDVLCRTVYVPQPGNPSKPEDLSSLRTAFRYDPESGAGFFFVNNYQRRYAMAAHPDAELTACAGEKQISFGRHTVSDGDYFFWPAGIRCDAAGRAVLKSASAVPLCILHTGGAGGCGDVRVFYTKDGQDPGYRMAEGSFTDLRTGAQPEPGDAVFLTLSEEEALHTVKVSVGEGDEYHEYLVISDCDAVPGGNGGYRLLLRVEDRTVPSFRIWPDIADTGQAPEGFVRDKEQTDPLFVRYTAAERVNDARAEAVPCADAYGQWAVRMTPCRGAVQTLLLVDYDGDRAGLYPGDLTEGLAAGSPDGGKTADHFYTGQTWEIDGNCLSGARGDAENAERTGRIVIRPLAERAPVFLETVPAMESGSACRIRQVRTAAVFAVPLQLR